MLLGYKRFMIPQVKSPPVFDEDKLLSCIDDRVHFSKRFSLFKRQYQEINQQWIHKSVLSFARILQNNQNPPIRKVDTIRAIKQGLQTCEYSFITLVEVEILPIFMDIARYRRDDKDEDRGRTFFLAGLKDSRLREEMEKVGNSYLRIVLQCIQMWAKVKPYYMIEGWELEEVDSEWMVSLKQLKSEGVTFPSHLTYFQTSDIEMLEKNLSENSANIAENRDRYIEYYNRILRDGLLEEGRFLGENMQHLMRLYKYGDGFLVCEALKTIESNLLEATVPPVTKILSLKLLNEVFKSAEYDVVEFAKKITPALLEIIERLDPVDTSLKRGQQLFKGELGKRYGPIYYSQLMKSLQLWASCVPADLPLKIKPSVFALGLEKLKDQKRLEMAKVSSTQLSSYKKEFSTYSLKNQIKNDLLREAENQTSVDALGSLKNTSISSRPMLHRSSVIFKARAQHRSSSMLFPLPRISSLNHKQKDQTLKNILIQIQNLIPSKQLANRQWLIESIQYISKYSATPSSIQSREDTPNRIRSDNLERAEKVLRMFQKYEGKEISYEEFVSSLKGGRGSHLSSMSNGEIVSNIVVQRPSISHNRPEEAMPKITTLIQEGHNISANQSISQAVTAQFLPIFQPEIRAPGPSFNDHNNSSNHLITAPLQPQPTSRSSQNQTLYRISQTTHSVNSNISSKGDSSGMELDVSNKTDLSRELIENHKQTESRESISHRFSKDTLEAGRRDSKSESLSDAAKSKQKFNIEGFEHNLLDSKLSLLKREDSYRRAQDNASPRNQTSLKSIQANGFPLQLSNQKQTSASLISQKQIPPLSPRAPSFLVPVPSVSASVPPISTSPSPREDFNQSDASLSSFPPTSKPTSPRMQHRSDLHGQKSNISQPHLASEIPKLPRSPQKRKQGDSRIQEPLLCPQTDSYYELSELREMQHPSSLTFRTCFNSDRFMIPNGGNKLWSEKEIFDWRLKLGDDKDNAVQQMFTDLQNKHTQEIRLLEEYYKGVIKNLEDKVMGLETRLYESQPHTQSLYKQIDTRRVSHLSPTHLSPTRSPLDLSPKPQPLNNTPFINLQMFQMRQNFKQPLGQRFNQQIYKYHLLPLRDNRSKRLMLKNKDILLKSNSLEVGCIVSKDTHLKIVLYISSSKHLKNFSLKVVNPAGFQIHVQGDDILLIQSQRQQKCTILVECPNIHHLPLEIPQIKFSFSEAGNTTTHSYQTHLPCTLNRFLTYNLIPHISSFNSIFNQSQSFRTEECLWNPKILKEVSDLRSLLPKFVQVKDGGERREEDVVFGADVELGQYRVLVRCVVRPTECMYWQGYDPTRQCPDIVIQSVITTFSWLFSS